MGLKHFIFDLDGTLIDTEVAILKTWQETLKEYNYDFSIKELKVVLGVTTEIGLQRLNAHVDEYYVSKWANHYGKYALETHFFVGTKEMLQELKEKGYSLGIVSSRSRDEYEKYFSQFDLENYFSTVVLQSDTDKHKPNPEPLYKYIELAGARKEECIYIGDMVSDIQCASRAGIVSGLVTWNQSGVMCEDANFIFSQPEDIYNLIG